MMMNVPMPAGYIRDDGNRANSSSLGSNYRIDSGTSGPQILNNAFETFNWPNFGPGEDGAWADWSNLTGSTVLVTDNYRIRAQLKATSLSSATNNFTAIGLAVPNVFSSTTYSVWFYYGLTAGNGMFIATQQNAPTSPYIAGGTGQTIRASTTSFTPSTTALLELERRGNVFSAFVNGSSAFTPWTDVGNLVGTGFAQRRPGLIVEGNNPNFSVFGAPAIDWWDVHDLVA